MVTHKLYLLVLLLLINSCGSNEIEKVDTRGGVLSKPNAERATSVNIEEVKLRDFPKQVLSQGKIRAKTHSKVSFELRTAIKEIFIDVGTKVKAGQTLATLEDFDLKSKLQKVENQIAQAEVNIEAKLIGLGYNHKDSVPTTILKNVRLENNLTGLEIDRKAALNELSKAKVLAPISGVVAKVEAQVGNLSSNYQTLCTIIDNNNLLILFPILEVELLNVQIGQHVSINPLQSTGRTYSSKVVKITPQVDDQGTILVYAEVLNPDDLLLDGMTVSVVVEKITPKQIMVPKSAVVDRQDKLVVFTYKKGKAYWNYVETGLENGEHYVINNGLKIGDTIITENNFHLSHLEEVAIRNYN